ncbi:nicotinate-nucleotide-dimethylbenzimidazole phosphoribosyltransferase [Lachnotalea glycerini]|uniref:Nicotinate-nucleotide--dimethylbenzimidazole phosphoribosyltransferase n=1 Tax=Lachnotalea glycerini TaxID=1763509 RepID=A0A318ETH8_9FIRM|nr:nicotinate-nucleotide--dimethylbenzimidazole phosphoribosyltransferase [Lachnotalea glycerini]OYO92500.1 nicotinate-nucleotide--dimethylbenzimidazole phosphoribosyltransferase [Lachnotalea glycerini]PXV95810.1 nicotinate-nucleotide-dimethylbenzimidazole phosphoribosyltransferase [Lachnotalea glycerini]
MTLEEQIKQIKTVNKQAMKESKLRWDSIAKPLNSLGKLEKAVIKIAGITNSHQVVLDKKALIIMCADNGIVEEGVTQTGQEVTAIVAENFLKKKASVSIMSDYTHTDIFPIDIGVAKDTNIINKKIAYGTKNFAKEPAMTYEEAKRAIQTGIDMVGELKEKGYHIIATGEMGIGNTTTSSAIAALLLGKSVEEVTGKGAGLSNEGLNRKIQVIQDALLLHKPDKENMIDVLSKIGGFDIAGLAGVFLGGAMYHIPVVIDGFISAVSALVAARMNALAIEYMLPSHASKEPAAWYVLQALGLEPFITCDMCLGEGTGAVAVFSILDMATAVYNSMSTFEQIEVAAYQPLS